MQSSKRQLLLASFLMACLACVGAATVWRVISRHQVPGPFDIANQGFCDFQNGVYFPSLAFGQRVSPYSQAYAQSYPVERSIPFFSPVVLAWHWPFSLLDLRSAEIAYALWLAALIAGISYWVAICLPNKSPIGRLNEGLLVALVLIASRSGQQTLFTGYFTFELILASLVAVRYGRERPWLSALALVVVSAKPNYVLPIGILMLVRGHWHAVLRGGVLAASLAAVCFWWIMPDGGVGEMLQQIATSQEIHRLDPIERPVNTWIRVDLLAVIAKWSAWDPDTVTYLIAMVGLLLPACIKLISAARANKAKLQSVDQQYWDGFLLLTSVVAIYHHIYDVLLVIGLLGWLVFRPLQSKLPRVTHYLICGCLLFPLFNYASSQMVLQRLDIDGPMFQVITSLNAIALIVAWGVMLFHLPGACKTNRSTTESEPASGEAVPSH